MSSLSNQFFRRKQLSNRQDKRAIVFIDSKFPGYKTLVQQVRPEARAIIINSPADGVREITSILNSSCCREMYLICDGTPGCLRFGNSELSINTLIQYEPQLQSWFAHSGSFDAKSEELPRLYFHGCNVAAGDVGDEFITKLGRMTGAIIAASAKVKNCQVINQSVSDPK